VLDAAFREAQAIVVLLTGDDMARLGKAFVTKDDPVYETEPTPQPRPNVLFEAGMAFGRHPDRTILVSLGSTRPFSDIAGRHTLHLVNTEESKRAFLSMLKIAGCDVDENMDRSVLLGKGDFEATICDADQEAGRQ
jgi:predicted nucleotide-binding protein